MEVCTQSSVALIAMPRRDTIAADEDDSAVLGTMSGRDDSSAYDTAEEDASTELGDVTEPASPLPRPASHHLDLSSNIGIPALVRRCSSDAQLDRAMELAEAHDPPPPSFFFTGCAWGCAFHVGAYRGMIERWGLERLRHCKFGGNSAGVLIAVAAAVGIPWKTIEDIYLELARQAVNVGVVGKMSRYHSDALDQLVGPTTHLEVAGRLFVGVTFKHGYEVSSSWASRDELLNTLHASMHIPFYCSHIEPIRGRAGVDGGLAAPFYLIDGEATRVVDAFAASSLASRLSLLRLEPVFPILGDRYAALHSEGRKALLGRVPPGVLSLHWPSAIAACMWFGRGAEELIAGLARAFEVWKVKELGRQHDRKTRAGARLTLLLAIALLLAWLLRGRAPARGALGARHRLSACLCRLKL